MRLRQGRLLFDEGQDRSRVSASVADAKGFYLPFRAAVIDNVIADGKGTERFWAQASSFGIFGKKFDDPGDEFPGRLYTSSSTVPSLVTPRSLASMN